VRYRLNASLERRDSYRDEVEYQAAFVAPSLTFLLGSKTRWTVDDQFRDDEGTVDGGIASPEATFGAFDALSDDVFLNEPDARFSNRYLSLASTLEHQLASGWTLRAIVGNFDYDRGPFDVVLGALDSDTLSIARRADFRDLDIGVLYGEVGALGSFETGSLRHSIAFGLTFDRRTSDEVRRRENIESIDIFAPVYTGVPAFESMPLFRSRESELEMLGVYLQDRIEIGERVVAQLGARLTDLNQDDDNRLTDSRQTIEATELSPQVGLVYRVTDEVSLYGSYSKSFDANSGLDAEGNQFEPKFGEQFEAGVKTELAGGRLSLTAAGFRLTYDGLLGNIRNPETGVFETFRSGIQRSTGFEIDVQGRLTDDVQVIGSYTAMNAEVVEDPRFETGRVLGGAPDHSGSVWLSYAPAQGFGASAGVFFQTEFKTFTSSSGFLPGFATAEVGASYRFGPAAIRGVVKNLFDKRYYWDAFRNLAYPASPRSFRLSLELGL